jgi:L-lactate dehydrogenase complex protein LldE
MDVALFVACYNDTLFPNTGKAVVRVLERLGHTVSFPRAQTCCGQMHVNTGYQQEVVPLVRNFVHAFGDAEAVVSPSASCVGMVRELYPSLAAKSGDPALQEAVDAILPKVHEFSELLVDVLEVTDVGAYYPHRATFHPTCHSVRMLHVADRPKKLLDRVRGLELVELDRPLECCGFGGTFAVKNADTSAAMLADKASDVLRTRAEVCIAVDNSCLMHIGGGLSRLRTGVEIAHLAEVLASEEPRKGARA